jgi:GNAT superfamily N-acetyltransferase
MATLYRLGPASSPEKSRRVPLRPEARALLEVPAAYGGRGAWMERRYWPQLRRFLERCREDLALYRGKARVSVGAARLGGALAGVGEGRKRCFLAGLFDSAGELCAVVDVTRREPGVGEWWIGLILVRPDLRGRGIGAAVVDAVEEWVRAEGGRAIFLAVQRRNAAALCFARRTGFVPHAEATASAGKVDLLVKPVA